MFSDYSTSKLLVADRQARYRHEAQQHRLARWGRRRSRTSARTGTTPPPRAERRAPTAQPPSPGGLAAA